MTVFTSKKDWWVLAFLICMTGLLVQLLLTMYAKGTMQQYPVHTAVYMLTVVVIWWPVVNTRYIVSNDVLTVKCMWLKWQIPVQQIQSIQETDYSVVAPALSLKRLRIDYEQAGQSRFILLSPRRADAFRQAITQAKT